MYSDGLPVDLTYIDGAKSWHYLSKYAAEQRDMVLTLPEWQTKQQGSLYKRTIFINVAEMPLYEKCNSNVFKTLLRGVSFLPSSFTGGSYKFASINPVLECKNIQNGVDFGDRQISSQ